LIYKKTKIICTIGPAVETPEKIEMLINAGMDGARLNFSHGNHAKHLEYINNIREVCDKLHKMVAIIQDLGGPKIRIGKLENGMFVLENGEKIKVCADPVVGNHDKISTNYPGIIYDLKKDHPVMIDDGTLELKVLSEEPIDNCIQCEVVRGGILKENKGLNLPHSDIKLHSLTEKDITDLEFGLENNVDFIAMSFVRSAEDIRYLRSLIESKGKKIPIIAKIERREAIDNIDSIIEASDLIMVARGDLGVELSTEQVPILQKMIIRKCNEKIRPVITATQMLDSMIEQPTPTRAEASDIANAILDGTDCVMLSGETSTGRYPVETVETMKKIILRTETIKKSTYFEDLFVEDSPENTLHTIANSATEIATRLSAKAIICITHTGKTPLLLSNHRPGAQIIAATFNMSVIRYFKLIWGVESLLIEKDSGNSDYSEVVSRIKHKVKDNGVLAAGDRVIFVSSMPLAEGESANNISISEI
jgi:pyruvate kinase